MAKLLPNQFQQYELEPKEFLAACILTEGNIQLISTKLATAMIERANLSYDPAAPITVFVQQEAALMGEIRAYQTILDAHSDAVAAASISVTDSENPTNSGQMF